MPGIRHGAAISAVRAGLALALVIGAATAPGWAEPQSAPAPHKLFPPAFRGLWLVGKSCDAAVGFNVVASDFGLYGTFMPGADGKFLIGSFGTASIVEATPDRVVRRERHPTPENMMASDLMVSEIKDGRRFSHWQDRPNEVTELLRCPSAHLADARARSLLRFLRRVESFGAAYAEIGEQCRTVETDAAACAGAIVRIMDINGDGKIAPAELTSFMRHYAPLTLLLRESRPGESEFAKVDPDDLAGVEGATAVFGPFVTNVVFSNFDYDGNGSLSVAEIALALKEEQVSGGNFDAARLLRQSRKQLDEAMGSVSGLGQMLGVPGGGGPPGLALPGGPK